jgi:hypothetical protein
MLLTTLLYFTFDMWIFFVCLMFKRLMYDHLSKDILQTERKIPDVINLHTSKIPTRLINLTDNIFVNKIMTF